MLLLKESLECKTIRIKTFTNFIQPFYLSRLLNLQSYMGFGLLQQIIPSFSVVEDLAPISHF
jgi:hypothetical protein